MMKKATAFILLIFLLVLTTQASAQFWQNKKKETPQQDRTARTTNAQPAQQRNNHTFKVFTYSDQMSTVWAFKMLIPEDWKFSGGINWMPKPYKLSETHFSVSAPNGSAEMEVLPDYQFWWSQQPYAQQMLQSQGFHVAQPMQAMQLLENVIVPEVGKEVSNIRIVKRLPLQQVANDLTMAARRQQQVDQCFAQLAAGMQIQYDVAQVDVSFTLNGIPGFATIITKVIYVTNPMQAIIMWGPEQTVVFSTTEAGKQVNLEKFVIMYSSMTENPVFNAKLCQVNMMMLQSQRQQLASIGELSSYISRTYNEISDMVMSSYEQKNQAYDRVFDQWGDYMRSVETYKLNDVEVKVPNTCENVWIRGDQVLFTDDPGFNPHDGSWTRMERR